MIIYDNIMIYQKALISCKKRRRYRREQATEKFKNRTIEKAPMVIGKEGREGRDERQGGSP